MLTATPISTEPPVIESTAPYSSPAGSGLWLTVAGRNLNAVSYGRLLPSLATERSYDVMVAASTSDSLWLWISDGLPVGLYTLELCTTNGQCMRQTDALEMYFDGVAISYLWPNSVTEGAAADAYIYGRGLLPGVTVTVGGLPATNVQASGTWMVFSTPVGLPVGQHDVTVMLSDTSSTLVGGFWVVSADAGTPTATPEVGIPPMPTPMSTPAPTATPNSTEPPVIASTTPYSAVARSGPWLQVTGRNLLQVSRVRLLPSEAGAEGYEVYFTASSATEMSVFVYNGVPAGRYALELCTAAGSCATQQDALLLYDGGVSIGYVWPGAVSAGSSADVYIYGRDLTPEVTVTIGGRPVTVVQVYNSSIMHVRTPADLPIGQHDVTAILSGTSSTMTGAFSVMGDAVDSIWPNRQIAGTSAETYLYGYGFAEGMSVTIGGLPVPYLSVNGASIMQIRTPAELPLGTHDVVVRYPDATITLPAAYEVIEERRSDWFALPEGLWTLPADARQGEPAMLALTVYRQGGTATRDARVSFYVLNDAGVPQLIDVVSTTLLEPGTLWHSAGQASTTWVPNAADSVVTLMAVIDAEGQTDDLDLTNNVVTRTITVQPSMADGAAPALQSLTVNGGAQATAERAVTVTIDVSGTASMMYLIEREFNAAAGVWIPVHNTGWIRYERNYPLTLMGASGLHYVQAWVSDEMGRISSNSGLARINYNAAPEGIARGQVRMFRYPLAAGQTATITLETLRGDADLYVWNADGSMADRSTVDSVGVDQVVVAANASGDYQIEVYGYEDSEYRLTVEYGAGAQRPGAMRAAAATSKALRSAPVVQPASQPAAVVALPGVPMDAETSPPVTPPLPGTPGSTQNIYLPMVVLP